jgi:hypothetical protein
VKILLHKCYTSSVGRCLWLGTTHHLREARWKYPREATAAGLCVGEVATLFLNGVVERLRSCEAGGRRTSGTASSTQFCHYQISFFPPTAEYNCTGGSCITHKSLRWNLIVGFCILLRVYSLLLLLKPPCATNFFVLDFIVHYLQHDYDGSLHQEAGHTLPLNNISYVHLRLS